MLGSTDGEPRRSSEPTPASSPHPPRRPAAVWLVTGGTTAARARRGGAAGAETLRDRYAVVTEGGQETPLPLGRRDEVALRLLAAAAAPAGGLPGAAIAYLGALVAVAFLYSNPVVICPLPA